MDKKTKQIASLVLLTSIGISMTYTNMRITKMRNQEQKVIIIKECSREVPNNKTEGSKPIPYTRA